VVSLCADRAWIVVILALVQVAVVMAYTVRHFAMSTDTYALLSPKLPWRIRETEFYGVFRQAGPPIVVVVDGQTPELADAATAALTESLRKEPLLFRTVYRPGAGPFWARNGLLYASTKDVRETMARLIQVEPFLGPLAADPSLRGVLGALSLTLKGVNSGRASFADIAGPIRRLADALEGLRDQKRVFFSWRNLISGGPPKKQELRHVILVDPKLEFSQLEPGQVAIAAIRTAARALQLDGAHGVRVRLTGPVPLQDEEFATLAERASLIAALAFGAITVMLWMAVRSLWLIVSILATTLVGLVSAAALGLAVFQRFNVISVAFIPLFVGLGIDIGIQFSVRYRAERATGKDVRDALIATARGMGRSLTLAATAIAAGFLALAPTAYYGVSQLGVIAGFGMFIALALNLTLLPALIQLTRPPGVAADAKHPRLERLDSFVLRHRVIVLGVGIASGVVSAFLLPLVRFDSDPVHLRSSRVESVATLHDLTNDPQLSPSTLEAIRPDLAAADALAARVRLMPEVSQVRTLSSFVPADQAEKIAIIADAANLLDLALNPISVAPPPSDAQVLESLHDTSAGLRQVASRDASAGDALRLADALDALAKAAPSARAEVAATLLPGLTTVLGQIRDSLQPLPISIATLPSDLVRAWLAPDGRARVSITPKGDANDNAVLSRFLAAGIKAIPDATGTPLSIHEAGRAVVGAFAEAGVLSFVAITVLLLATLRRVRDVAITMAPIVLTGLLTMASCVLMDQPLNFANIIALPLLFGIGVAFHIYFVMAWRAGGSHLLTSSLARAVFFSALATATGFGSLWASSHPGTASMGKLLMISLVWTLVSALLFQPALMGLPPATRASGN
jgi:hopanoid biosynthesis associated RND transporter like protein HpnN